MQQRHLVADCDASGAPHYNPVFGAVMVPLQRQAAALLDDDALDLKTIAIVERLVGTPGSMDLEMILGDRRCMLLQLRDDLPQTIGPVAFRHQDGVGRGDNDDVLQPEQRHNLLIGGHVDPAVSTNTAEPCAALSAASRSDNSHTACHDPTSDQP